LTGALELVATLCAGYFAGAAFYVSLVEQPARLACPMPVALAEFRPGFPRARALQASLALLGTLCAILAWLRGAGKGWLVAATCLASVVGFTLARLAPVYARLLDPSLDAESPEARPLLVRWGRLHAVRTALGFSAFLACLSSLLGP